MSEIILTLVPKPALYVRTTRLQWSHVLRFLIADS